MSDRMKRGLSGLLLLLVPTVAAAKTEHRFDSGPCKEGEMSEWYCVTTFEDGVAVSAQGRGCDGRLYQYDRCDEPMRVVGSDPRSDRSSVHTGRCGATGEVWRGEILFNSGMQFAGVHGHNCAGEYYIIEGAVPTYPEEGATEGIE